MKRLINYLMHQKLLVNLIVIMVSIVGVMSISHINRESIPNAALNMVTISTVYPGASPNDVEDLISIPIEKKLRSVSHIDKVRSYNVDNLSLIVAYLSDNAVDKAKVIQDIKDAVEQVGNLPSGVQKPLVAEVTFDTTELVSVAFTGKSEEVPYSRLREFANRSENFLYDVDGVAKVEKLGYYDREYLVEVDPDALDRHRIGLNTLVQALKMRNINYPGGPLRVGNKEFVLRTKGQFRNADEIRNTVIRGNDTGFMLRVGDIAKVTDTYEEADVHHRLNGKRAVVFKLWKKREADEIDLTTRLRRALATYSVPGFGDVDITLFDDQSIETKNRLRSVIEEAIVGFVILGLFMLMLLGRRMSLLVLGGIPISFMIAFTVIKYLGLTFNIMSLFGMIMVLGMIVDFSIVVAENSHRYMERGLKRSEAISTGVSEVFWSVTVTFICIITAFVPLLLVSGIVGRFIRSIPIVIITALVASWLIAMFVLPMYLNMFLGESHKKGKRGRITTLPMRLFAAVSGLFGVKHRTRTGMIAKPEDADENFEGGLFGKIQSKYKKILRAALNHRYLTVGILLIFFAVSLYLLPIIGFKFFPEGGEEKIRLSIKMPIDMTLDANLEETKKIERIILEMPAAERIAAHTYVGEEYVDIVDPKPPRATFKSTIDLFLCPEKDRSRTSRELNFEIRGKIAAAQQSGLLSPDISVKVESIIKGPPIGKPVNVEIRGKDYDVIREIAKEYEEFLSTVKGVRDISIDLEEGKTEYRYTVNERMAAWTGVSAYDIAVALNASFMGAVATTVSQNEEEVGVRVRFEENARKRFTGLKDVKIANMTGGLIPLDSVSSVRIDKGFSQINRLNFKRLVQVQADVDMKLITPVEVTRLLEKKFTGMDKKYPGYFISYGGEQEDTNKSMGELGLYFIMALIVIFIVITIFMRSLIMPVVVMSAIPFSLVGVIFALFTHRLPLSFMSALGLFSLAGIIVSNTLVLVQFINNFRDEGLGLKDALIEGGVVRLRPIILTAGSMVLELIPVIYGFGGKDYLVSPLALTFGYGLIFATFITLVLIPCFYHIAEDVKGFAAGVLSLFGIKMSREIYNGQRGE